MFGCLQMRRFRRVSIKADAINWDLLQIDSKDSIYQAIVDGPNSSCEPHAIRLPISRMYKISSTNGAATNPAIPQSS